MGKYALLIGIDTYGEGLQPLPAASKDVAALREVLLNPQMGGFDEVKPLINPTQPEMAREIELWFQDRRPEDLVLMFFSGHGVKDDRRDLYFAATDTEKQRDRLLKSTAISARSLHERVRDCKAKYQVLILDCCFSGAFGEFVARDDGEVALKEQLGAEGRVVLTSTSAVDYSFEEKGSDLSIYTRYLVEGIATGAADEDGDGVITIDELHCYAGRKVKETSPAMSPEMITLKGEGFRIQIARSPQDDPKLKYRKEAESKAAGGRFTIPAKQKLMALRAELGLSDEEAEEIEIEVIKPHQEYQRKLEEYYDVLRRCLDEERILGPKVIEDLIDLRDHLKLRKEDVAPVERACLNGRDLEGYVAGLERQREEAERQKQASANQPQPETDNLSSERFGANYYAKLRDLLAAQDWRAADQETLDRMREVMSRQNEGWLRIEDIKKFPCLDLGNIDQLWVKYSKGKFGFSVQRDIWYNCDRPAEYETAWNKFTVAVGWRTKGVLGMGSKWLKHSQLTFDFTAPKGHLPSERVGSCRHWLEGNSRHSLFSRYGDCRLNT
ncbi:caspase, EACC1-associated type [Nodosilinea sp. PGN35]|uniref:caspase, EACC1-associated type n=1 Tax=Nodosilinea sp. PGN35 TaxID=3020489 RepID=UPI0023B2A7B2|nr:GUN4 domain-containing protein [Nodosilinea sp. TSF1-S3]MDF0369713.1 GUN4 domain-containing protein [Nodosilinea sp. TSF1-S3]